MEDCFCTVNSRDLAIEDSKFFSCKYLHHKSSGKLPNALLGCHEHSSQKHKPRRKSHAEDSYIYANIKYYDAAFQHMRESGKILTWNWSAFVFSPSWFFYRKMYYLGFATLIAFITLTVFYGWLVFAVFITMKLMIGLYGNNLYMVHIEKAVSDGRYLQEPEKSAHLKKHGGTSSLSAVLSGAAYVIISVLITAVLYL